MPEILSIACIDGESKTGKSTARDGLVRAYEVNGRIVYSDSAGEFYRRLVGLTRLVLRLNEDDPLPRDKNALTLAAETVIRQEAVFSKSTDVGDLERPSIKNSVAVLAELPVAQAAGDEWYVKTAELSIARNADVLVIDGRNPRAILDKGLQGKDFLYRTDLEIVVTCTPEVAAERSLRHELNPSIDHITDETEKINSRRIRDRNRPINPYRMPDSYEVYRPGISDAPFVIASVWKALGSEILPRPIVIDNSLLTRDQLWGAMSDLCVASLEYQSESMDLI